MPPIALQARKVAEAREGRDRFSCVTADALDAIGRTDEAATLRDRRGL
jgi:hypothetical protein